MKMRKSKGVLSKDGKTPYAARTLHYIHRSGETEWKSPCDYTMANLAKLFLCMSKGDVDSIQLIDENNDQYVIELTASEKRALPKQRP